MHSGNIEDEYTPNITSYSIKFKQYQFVNMNDDDMADDKNYGIIISINVFFIFYLLIHN